MADELRGRRIAVLFTDGVEQIELTTPVEALRAAGAEVHLVTPHEGPVQGMDHVGRGEVFEPDRLVSQVNAVDYHGLVLPGGVRNPDKLRMDREAVALVRAFAEGGKPVAAICHGPWLLVEADVVRGRTLTSYPSLQTDIRNAGGAWIDREVVVDETFVTSRNPDDLPAFNKAILTLFREHGGAEERRAA
jgi:protease I